MVSNNNGNTRVYLFFNVILFSVIALFVYFNYKFAYNETTTGVFYKILEEGKGKSILERITEIEKDNKEKNKEDNSKNKDKKDSYFLKFERCITYKGKIIEYPNQNIYSFNVYPYEQIVENNCFGDYFECLSMFKNIGDRYIFKIKSSDFDMYPGMNIKEDDYVCIELKLVDVFSSKLIGQKYRENLIDFTVKLQSAKEADCDLIARYLDNIGRSYSNNGDFYFIVDDYGRGDKIKNGDKVKFVFSVKAPNGKIFVTNDKDIAKKNDIYDNKKKYEPLEITMDDKFNETPYSCFKYLKKGSTGKIFFPGSDESRLEAPSFYEMWYWIIDVEKPKEEIKDNKVDEKTDVKNDNIEVKNNVSNDKDKAVKDNVQKDKVNVSANNNISKSNNIVNNNVKNKPADLTKNGKNNKKREVKKKEDKKEINKKAKKKNTKEVKKKDKKDTKKKEIKKKEKIANKKKGKL